MTYNIFSSSAPAMPSPGKGTEIIKLYLSQVSSEIREAITPMPFSAFASHLQGVKVMYCNNRFLELHGQINHFIGSSGVGKDQLDKIVETICRSLRTHDQIEMQKIAAWQAKPKKEREKTTRPTVAIFCPPADTTKPAFIQNAIACENADGHAQYFNQAEVEMLDCLCGGRKASGQMLINIHDVKREGALRATAEGVSGNPVMRANINISSTEEAAREYYKRDIRTGKTGRVSFAYKPRGERKGEIPREGAYDETFQAKMDRYLERLDNTKGNFIIKPLNKIADQLAAEMAQIADIADDDTLFDLSHRCILAAWKKGATLWILNNQTWTRSIGEFVVWFCYFDLWSKMHVLGDMFKPGTTISDVQEFGPKNMLTSLGDSFSQAELEALRVQLEKPVKGTKHQINVWMNRGFITYSAQTGLYNKTAKFLQSHSS